MSRVVFHRVFSAAHRLWSDSSKCQNIHGHNYRVTVEVKGPIGAESGMVVPFDWIKDVVDHYDHSLILHDKDPQVHELGRITRVVAIPYLPTTENVAQVIADEIAAHLGADGKKREVIVTLAETDNIASSGRSKVPRK